MMNSKKNPLVLVVGLAVSANAHCVNMEPAKEKIANGVDTVVNTAKDTAGRVKEAAKDAAGKVRNTLSRKKEDIKDTLTHQTQEIPLAGVSTIKVSGNGTLVVTQNKLENDALVVESAKGDMPEVEARVEGSTLTLVLKERVSLLGGKLTYRANIGKFCDLEVSDKATVEFADVTVDKLAIRSSGNSKISGEINAKQLSVETSGKSRIMLSGFAHEQIVKISDRGVFDGNNLGGRSMNVNSSGHSSVYSDVSDVIEGRALNSSSVMYANGPVIDIESSDSSSVRKL
jgi:hypothetical protein